MKHISLLIFCLVLLSSCSNKLADFMVDQPAVKVPATSTFSAKTLDADQVLWEIDGNIYTDTEIEHQFLKSGKHEVKLTVNKGGKSKSVTKEVIFAAPDKCLSMIETEYGDIMIELYDDTPKHRDNFVKLADESFYDGTLFHRVIKGFMVQGGDPKSKAVTGNARLGSGGPGYQIDAEFNEKYAHVAGAIAAARTGDNVNPEKKSSGSQFYIVHGKKVTESMLERQENSAGITYTEETKAEYLEKGGAPFLDGGYTVFGRVVEGMDIVDKIANTQTNNSDRPNKDVTMKVVVIK